MRYMALISLLFLTVIADKLEPGFINHPELHILLGWLIGYNTINSLLLHFKIYHPFLKFISAAGDILCATLLIRITGLVDSPFLIGYAVSILIYGVRYRFVFAFYCAILVTLSYIGFVLIESSGIMLLGKSNIFFEFLRMLYFWLISLFTHSDQAELFHTNVIFFELIKILLWWITALLAGFVGTVLTDEHGELQEAHHSLQSKVQELEALQEQYDYKQTQLDRSLIDLQVQSKNLEIERDRSISFSNELKLIRKHSQNVNTTFDIDKIYEFTVEIMAQLIETDYADLYRFDLGQKYGYIKLENSQINQDVHPLDARLAIANNPIAVLLKRQRTPLSIEDVADEEKPRQLRNLMRMYGFKSALLVPIIVNEEVLAVVGLEEAESQRVFTPHETQLCQTLAGQASRAIERAKLYESTRANTEKLQQAFSNLSQQTEAIEKRAQELALINEVSKSLSSTLDFDNMIQSVLTHMATLVGVSRSVLFLEVEDRPDQVKMIGEYDTSSHKTREIGEVFIIENHPLLKAIMLEGRVINIPDTSDTSLPEATRKNFQSYGIKSVLILPLTYRGRTVGAINLDEMEHKRTFTDDEIKFAQMLCNQAAIAIENSLLYTNIEKGIVALREFNERLSTLYEVSASLTVKLPVSDVLMQLMDNLGQIFEVQLGHAVLLSGDMDGEWAANLVVNYDRVRDLTDYLEEPIQLDDEYPSIQVMHNRYIMPISNILAEDMAIPMAVRELIQLGRVRSALIVPMVAAGKVIGAIELYFKEEGHFAEDQIKLISTAANQAAIAIENSRLYQELQQTTEMLEAVSQAKSNFVSIVSHDLRTPLTSIKSFSEILLDELEDEEADPETQIKFLTIINNETDRLTRLINDLLDLQKIESGKMEWNLEMHDFASLLKSSTSTFSGAARDKNIELKIEIDENVPKVNIDRDRFMQLIANLLSNAIKFTDSDGQVTISLENKQTHLLTCIADSGMGIPPDQVDYVFEKFRQVKGSKRKKEGTGLGLAIAKEVVEYHGGTIWVESELGAGSQFYFTIPIHQATETEAS